MILYYIILFCIIFIIYLYKKIELLCIISVFLLLQFVLIYEIYIDVAIKYGYANEFYIINEYI